MLTEYLIIAFIISCISGISVFIVMIGINQIEKRDEMKIHWRNVMMYDTLYFINSNFVTKNNEIVYWHPSEERIAMDYLHKILLAKHNNIHQGI